jgi:Ca2+-binding RTX toxin-like protein
MASLASAFDGAVSPDAYSYFLRSLPSNLRDDTVVRRDFSGPSHSTVKGTSASDYVVLGSGDKLAQLKGAPKGFDTVETSGSINISGTGFRGVVLTGEANAKVTGSKLGDLIAGNDGNNTVKAGHGNDVVAGGDGRDSIFGDDGRDSLFGDAGNDSLYGGDGADVLKGGSGSDLLKGDAGRDTIYGGDDADRLYGGEDSDRLYGGDDADRLYGGSGNDRLFGDAGDDRLYGDAGNDSLSGMVGDDQLFGGSGKDTLLGGDGDDSLFGGTGSDRLFGGAGHDTFEIAKGAKSDIDTIADFKAGEDVIDLSETAANKFSGLTLKGDGHGNTIVTVKSDGTKFKLVGYDPNDIDSTFFHF